MRRLTTVRSVMESRPASHARLTPRYASRSAAAYSGLIVSGIRPPQLQKRGLGRPIAVDGSFGPYRRRYAIMWLTPASAVRSWAPDVTYLCGAGLVAQQCAADE